MSNWDYNSKKQLESSDVMLEFIRLQKLAQDTASKLKNISETAKSTTEAVNDLSNTISNMSDDGEVGDPDLIGDEEFLEAKKALIKELNLLAKIASDNGDIKLTYQIERTIYRVEE